MVRNVRRFLVLALVHQATKGIRAKRSATKAHTVQIVHNAVVAQTEPHAMPKLDNVYARLDGKAITAIDRAMKDHLVKIVRRNANATMVCAMRKRANVIAVLAGLATIARPNAMTGSLDTIVNRNVTAIRIIRLLVMPSTDTVCVKRHSQVYL